MVFSIKLLLGSILSLCYCYDGLEFSTDRFGPWPSTSIHTRYVTDDAEPVGKYLRCEWLPACICRDESHYTNGTYKLMVNCTDAGLEQIPANIPSNTTVLTLDGNSIEKIEPRIFENLSILLYLDLSNNCIKNLPPGSFDGLQNLHTLELSDNFIRYTEENFPGNIFEGLTNLSRLNIQQRLFNKSKTEKIVYPVSALANLTRLKQLLIDGIDSDYNSTAFTQMDSVENLILSSKYGRCKLETIHPGMFKSLQYIKTMDLSNCSLKMVKNGSFSELKNLSELDLSFNIKLTFKSLANISYGLQSQNLRLLNLNNIHTPMGDCTRLTVENMKYMQNMSVERLRLDFNRLAYVETDAVQYIPRNITQLSLNNNMLLPAPYVHEVFRKNTFRKIKYLTLADQDTNIDVINIFDSETKSYLETIEKNYTDEFGKVDETNGTVMENHELPCNNCNTNSSDIIILLPPTLNFLDLSGLRIRNELKNICVCEPNKIIRIDLSRNLFWKWQGPIIGLSNLLNLNLAWNSCDNMSPNVFDNMGGLIELNLTRNFIDRFLSNDTEGRIFKGLRNLSDLLLSDMKLRYLPPKIFRQIPNLRGLDLSYNFLTEFEVDFSHLSRMQYLNLHENFVKKLEPNVMNRLSENSKNFTVYVDLSNNRLSCTCNDTEFINWFYETDVYFVGYYGYSCTYENTKQLNMSQHLDLHHRLRKDCANYSYLIIISSLILVLFMVLILMAICYRYRWDIRYFYYSAKLRMNGRVPLIDRNDENALFNFDAFISYSRENSSWVKQVIVPKLEEERNLKLLVHDRDFLAGNFVNDNIMGAITTSKKTLIVMSNEFLRSEWCIFEMNMARMEAIKSGRNVICVLLKEQVPDENMSLEIMDTIRRSTYIELDTDPERQDVFWDRVRDALLN